MCKLLCWQAEAWRGDSQTQQVRCLHLVDFEGLISGTKLLKAYSTALLSEVSVSFRMLYCCMDLIRRFEASSVPAVSLRYCCRLLCNTEHISSACEESVFHSTHFEHRRHVLRTKYVIQMDTCYSSSSSGRRRTALCLVFYWHQRTLYTSQPRVPLRLVLCTRFTSSR